MHTRVTPNQRHLSFRKFIENVSSSQEATQELADWGLVLDKGILQVRKIYLYIFFLLSVERKDMGYVSIKTGMTSIVKQIILKGWPSILGGSRQL